MILAAPSNASYLSETKGHSHTGGHFILSENDEVPQNNCAILATAQIIKAVMSSSAEMELGALYISMYIKQSHNITSQDGCNAYDCDCLDILAVMIACPKHIFCSHGNRCNGIYRSGDDDHDDHDDHCDCRNEHDICCSDMFCVVGHDHVDRLLVCWCPTSSRPFLLLLLLELIKDATHMISILALLEKAIVQELIIGDCFMRLHILLLMLLWGSSIII
jgi:hypothetical protein